jgi:hypothetical protein
MGTTTAPALKHHAAKAFIWSRLPMSSFISWVMPRWSRQLVVHVQPWPALVKTMRPERAPEGWRVAGVAGPLGWRGTGEGATGEDSAKSGVKRGGGSESGSTSRDWQASQAWVGGWRQDQAGGGEESGQRGVSGRGAWRVKMRDRGAGGKAATAWKGWGGDGWGRRGRGALPTLTGEGSPVKVMGT